MLRQEGKIITIGRWKYRTNGAASGLFKVWFRTRVACFSTAFFQKSKTNSRRSCELRRQTEEQQVTEIFDRAKAWIVRITELGLLLVALGIVLQMLFGSNVAFFGDIVGNVLKLVTALGSNGVVGLVAIAIILY
jgi:hypothetical protein